MRLKKDLVKQAFPYFLIGIAVTLRLMPHPPNFVPVAALALFGGTYLKKRYAIIIPLAAMLVSDFFIGFYDFKLMFLIYLSFAIVGLIGYLVRRSKKLMTVIGGTLAGSVIFFVVTNFGVWAFSDWYAHNLSGLIQCLFLALPFFRNTLLGNFFYVGLFFGIYETVLYLWRGREKALEIIKK